MIEPSLAFQSAVRAKLISDPAVTALVDPASIRSGFANVAQMPSIVFSGGQTQFLGRACGGQLVARVFLELNIWALEDGADTAQSIGYAVAASLFDAPRASDFSIDQYEKPGLIWMRDPQPERAYTHGVLTLEAVLRWRA